MEPTKGIEDELNEKLLELYNNVGRDRNASVDDNKIQQRMDNFLILWSDRITEMQNARLEANRSEIEKQHEPVGPSATIIEERHRARLVNADVEHREVVIKDQISQLREGLLVGIQDVKKGRQPNLVVTIEKQIEKPQARDFDQELADKLSAAMKVTIEKQKALETAPKKGPDGR